jgi:hypothetical protein
MPGYDGSFGAYHTPADKETVRTIESRIELDNRGDWYGESQHSRAVERRAEKIAEAIADGFTLATSFSYPDDSESIMVVDTFIRA